MKKYKRQKEVVEYFEANNIGHSESHKIDNARYEIYKVFDKNIYDLHPNQEFKLEGLIIDLEAHLPALEYLLMTVHRESGFESDRRRGWESYGFDTMEDDFMYISDRWFCAFRLQWIIDAIHYYKMDKALTPTYKKYKETA